MERQCQTSANAFGLYPHNRPLEEELQRLFAEPCHYRDLREISDDFRHNGVASDLWPGDCMDAISARHHRAAISRYLPRSQSPNNNNSNGKATSQSAVKKKGECVFCRNNGETRTFYQSHVVKDRLGKVTCPVLRNYRCPTCGASGDTAHTLKYCPDNKSRNVTPSVILLKSMRSSTGRRRCPSNI